MPILIKAKRIYQVVQQEQKEGEATTMEINVASIVEKLKEMEVWPPTKKMSHG